MGQEEPGVRAVEDDDVEVSVLLDQLHELGELRDGRGGDRVDRRVVEGHPAVAGAATVDAEVGPGPQPRIGTPPVVGRAGVDGAHGNLLTAKGSEDPTVGWRGLRFGDASGDDDVLDVGHVAPGGC